MATPYPSYREALRATMVEYGGMLADLSVSREHDRRLRTTLQLLESGEYEFSLTRVIRLCRLYGVDPPKCWSISHVRAWRGRTPDRFDALSLFCNVTLTVAG